MKKITQYHIVTNQHGVNLFRRDVQNHIDHGWHIYGNLITEDGAMFQVVVKYEDQEDLCTRPE